MLNKQILKQNGTRRLSAILTLILLVAITGKFTVAANDQDVKEDVVASSEASQNASESASTNASQDASANASQNAEIGPKESDQIKPSNKSLNIKKVKYKRYVAKKTKMRVAPKKKSKALRKLSVNAKVTVVGEIKGSKYLRIRYKGLTGYISKKKLSKKKVQTGYVWKGPKLTRAKGVNYGPSGKETYYNLNMSGVVSIMRSQGYNDKYWVRSDGVKMLGKYVMVGANFNKHPRGSLVPTSLGMARVCDTGTACVANPNHIDIATAW